MWILDGSDPGSPIPLGVAATPARDTAVEVAGGRAYLGSGEELRILDVSDPSAPTELGRASIANDVRDLVVVGDTVFLAAGGAGLRILDVSNPRAPVEVGGNAEHYARSVEVVEGHAFVATEQSGLWVVDARDRAAPRTESLLDTWGSADALAVANGHVFLADRSGGLVVVRSATAMAAFEREQRERAGLFAYAACRLSASSSLFASWRSALAAACNAATKSRPSTTSPNSAERIHHVTEVTVEAAGSDPAPGL
jgi:hypothetical protein